VTKKIESLDGFHVGLTLVRVVHRLPVGLITSCLAFRDATLRREISQTLQTCPCSAWGFKPHAGVVGVCSLWVSLAAPLLFARFPTPPPLNIAVSAWINGTEGWGWGVSGEACGAAKG